MHIPSRTLKDYLFILLKGIAMGAADVVPGVSGGTIAFITGIYDEFLYSLSQLTPKVLVVLKNEGFASAWGKINGNFLVALFSGILISIMSLARVISWAIGEYPILVWAFFFGLIVASIIYLGRQQRGWGVVQWGACLVGALLVYISSVVAPAQLPGHWWVLFIGGFIAICAMVLPGVSGSFLLLLMGLYPVVLLAITEFDVIAIMSIGAGCICGLLAFSRALFWLLANHQSTTMATLIGFLVGSLNVTWPWKRVVETVIDRHGEVLPVLQANVFPGAYSSLTGLNSMFPQALAFFAFGLILVLMAEFVSSRLPD